MRSPAKGVTARFVSSNLTGSAVGHKTEERLSRTKSTVAYTYWHVGQLVVRLSVKQNVEGPNPSVPAVSEVRDCVKDTLWKVRER